nr:hypothetical protein CFP56_42026 [Quercus suber]
MAASPYLAAICKGVLPLTLACLSSDGHILRISLTKSVDDSDFSIKVVRIFDQSGMFIGNDDGVAPTTIALFAGEGLEDSFLETHELGVAAGGGSVDLGGGGLWAMGGDSGSGGKAKGHRSVARWEPERRWVHHRSFADATLGLSRPVRHFKRCWDRRNPATPGSSRSNDAPAATIPASLKRRSGRDDPSVAVEAGALLQRSWDRRGRSIASAMLGSSRSSDAPVATIPVSLSRPERR